MEKKPFHTHWAGQAVRWYDEVDSTNLIGREWLAEGAPHGALIVASRQTRGRGRLDRIWVSETGGLYFSLLMHPKFSVREISRLVFAAALAMVEALNAACGLSARIKWPNDIVACGRKICGILLESVPSGLILGVGLNANQPGHFGDLSDKAASVRELTGKTVDEHAVLEAFLLAFESRCEACAGDPSALMREVEAVSATLRRKVCVFLPDGSSYEALAVGFGEDGSLIVDRNGQLLNIHAGDVSVRGLMGYTDAEGD